MALQIIRNNIVNVEADAIVNTANPAVGVGRGVDQSIYEAAGWDRLLEARERIGEIAPGEAAWTPAFGLHARYIIHTVGPAWMGGGSGERETVARCYRRSLELAAELGCESAAFPLIATGTYGFPKDEALRIAMAEISGFLLSNEMEVLLVVYDKESFEVSGKLFSDIQSFIDDSETAYVPDYLQYNRADDLQYKGTGDLQYNRADASDVRAKKTSRARRILDGFRERKNALKREEEPIPQSGAPYGDRDAGSPFEERNSGLPVGARDARSPFEEGDAGAPFMDWDAESMVEDLSMGAESGAYDDLLLSESMEQPAFEADAAPSYSRSFSAPSAPSFPSQDASLETRLKHLDKTFQEYLFMLIDRRGLSDTDVYKKANIDRKHFSKIRSNAGYKPSKKTALALAIALELNLDETKDLIGRAGLALSPSIMFDRIIEYCIETCNYDIYEINCILFKYDQPTLGA